MCCTLKKSSAPGNCFVTTSLIPHLLWQRTKLIKNLCLLVIKIITKLDSCRYIKWYESIFVWNNFVTTCTQGRSQKYFSSGAERFKNNSDTNQYKLPKMWPAIFHWIEFIDYWISIYTCRKLSFNVDNHGICQELFVHLIPERCFKKFHSWEQ